MSGERGIVDLELAGPSHDPLQRSPGSMSGESAADRQPPLRRGQYRFNGAPARCPGRVEPSKRRGAPSFNAVVSRFSGESPARCPGRGASTEPRLCRGAEEALANLTRLCPASTEPRLDVRGENYMCACVLRCIGAPARCPGRGWSGTTWIRRPPRVASTEPRLDVRGEAGARARCPTVTAFQRSPGSMSGERTIVMLRARRCRGFPATEPRLDVRGEVSGRPRGRGSRIHGLQRSPGSMSGERCGGNGRALGQHLGSTLQRSPGSMSGERLETAAGSCQRRRAAASTEPRLDVRGECLGRRSLSASRRHASTEPRLDVRGEGAASVVVGHGVPASTEPRLDVRGELGPRAGGDRGERASTEPRLDVRGDAASRRPQGHEKL